MGDLMNKSISLLGSTGSIGTQTLDVARNLGLRVTALSAHSNVKLLEEQTREFKPSRVSIGKEFYGELKTALADMEVEILCGDEGVLEIAETDESETIVNAVLGMKGLRPTVAAALKGKKIAFANKETLVAGGKIVTNAVAEGKSVLLPVDSEHSAIFQCIQGGTKIKKILLTGSGGPFLGQTKEYIKDVTPEMAIKHPRWSMGKKISVDSASLMNKGLEVIEAVHLFGVSADNIEVLVHRQSILHSAVELEDGAVIGQLGTPDMRLPIQYALTYPNRFESPVETLDLAKIGTLSFFEPDTTAFGCLEICKKAIAKGGLVPTAVNAANEIAVSLFLKDKIGFLDIEQIALDAYTNQKQVEYIKSELKNMLLCELMELDNLYNIDIKAIAIENVVNNTTTLLYNKNLTRQFLNEKYYQNIENVAEFNEWKKKLRDNFDKIEIIQGESNLNDITKCIFEISGKDSVHNNRMALPPCCNA